MAKGLPDFNIAMTVGHLRDVLAEFHESDLVMVEGARHNQGVRPAKVKTLHAGTRVVLQAADLPGDHR